MARVATLTIDLAEETKVRARASFPNEEDAKEGQKAANTALYLMQAGLDQGLQHLAKEPDTVRNSSLRRAAFELSQVLVFLLALSGVDLADVKAALLIEPAHLTRVVERAGDRNELVVEVRGTAGRA